jgi:hypothetical protein
LAGPGDREATRLRPVADSRRTPTAVHAASISSFNGIAFDIESPTGEARSHTRRSASISIVRY